MRTTLERTSSRSSTTRTRLCPPGAGRRAVSSSCRRRRVRRRPHVLGQQQREGRAALRGRRHLDVTASVFRERVDGGEPQAGATAFPFRGEEGIEDAFERLIVHPVSGVADAEGDVDAVGEVALAARHRLALAAHGDGSAARHRIARVQHEVVDGAFESDRVHVGGERLGGEIDDEHGVVGQHAAHRPLQPAEEVGHVHRLGEPQSGRVRVSAAGS